MIKLELTEEQIMDVLISVKDKDITATEGFDMLMLFQPKNRI